jgi:hypothetical protein
MRPLIQKSKQHTYRLLKLLSIVVHAEVINAKSFKEQFHLVRQRVQHCVSVVYYDGRTGRSKHHVGCVQLCRQSPCTCANGIMAANLCSWRHTKWTRYCDTVCQNLCIISFIEGEEYERKTWNEDKWKIIFQTHIRVFRMFFSFEYIWPSWLFIRNKNLFFKCSPNYVSDSKESIIIL